MGLFPEHSWKLWKFKNLMNNQWNETTVQKDFMQDLFDHLHYKTMDDWYQLEAQDVLDQGGEVLHNNDIQVTIARLQRSIFIVHSS